MYIYIYRERESLLLQSAAARRPVARLARHLAEVVQVRPAPGPIYMCVYIYIYIYIYTYIYTHTHVCMHI